MYLHKGTNSQNIYIVVDLVHNSTHHGISFDHNMSKHYYHTPDIHHHIHNPSVISDHYFAVMTLMNQLLEIRRIFFFNKLEFKCLQVVIRIKNLAELVNY